MRAGLLRREEAAIARQRSARTARTRRGRASTALLLTFLIPSVAALAVQEDRLANLMQHKAGMAGKNWQSALPAIGTPMHSKTNAWPLTPGQAFDHASSSSRGAYCECSIYRQSQLCGRILFNTAGDNEGPSMLQGLLCPATAECTLANCVVELTHIDVAEGCRGLGGGPLLLRLMLKELASREDTEGECSPRGRAGIGRRCLSPAKGSPLPFESKRASLKRSVRFSHATQLHFASSST
jgi:hypothetical protein